MARVKRKGAYEWQGGGWYADGYNGWHQNASCRVVAKVTEQVLLHGVNIRETIAAWPDLHDFMLRAKVNRTMYLMWGDEEVQRTTRYFVSTTGKPLVKHMPPLPKDPEKWRTSEMEAGWKVQVCNDIKHAEGVPIDYSYYVARVEDLVMRLK